MQLRPAAGTPGRVYDMIQKQHLRTRHIKTLILDEADEMLSKGFTEQIYNVYRYLPPETQASAARHMLARWFLLGTGWRAGCCLVCRCSFSLSHPVPCAGCCLACGLSALHSQQLVLLRSRLACCSFARRVPHPLETACKLISGRRATKNAMLS